MKRSPSCKRSRRNALAEARAVLDGKSTGVAKGWFNPFPLPCTRIEGNAYYQLLPLSGALRRDRGFARKWACARDVRRVGRGSRNMVSGHNALHRQAGRSERCMNRLDHILMQYGEYEQGHSDLLVMREAQCHIEVVAPIRHFLRKVGLAAELTPA